MGLMIITKEVTGPLLDSKCPKQGKLISAEVRMLIEKIIFYRLVSEVGCQV